MKRYSPILLLCVLLAGNPLTAKAQFPGSHLTGANRARIEFLTTTLQAVAPVITRWKQTMASDDARAAAALFVEDGLYSSVDGTVVQGRTAIEEALVRILPRMGGFASTVVDYTASGNMVYQFGRFNYAWTAEGGFSETQSGTYVMILYQEGRDWKIRSYVERGNAPPSSG